MEVIMSSCTSSSTLLPMQSFRGWGDQAKAPEIARENNSSVQIIHHHSVGIEQIMTKTKLEFKSLDNLIVKTQGCMLQLQTMLCDEETSPQDCRRIEFAIKHDEESLRLLRKALIKHFPEQKQT